MNVLDIVLIVLIAAALAAATVKCIRNKKHGSGCCGDCTKCGSSCKNGKL